MQPESDCLGPKQNDNIIIINIIIIMLELF